MVFWRRMRKSIIMIAAACTLVLPMCDQVEGPLPAGQVTAADPQADALVAKAKNLMAAKKLGAAKSVLMEVAEYHALAPIAPQARMLLGEIEERRNDPREAFKQYGKIVERYQGSDLYEQARTRQLAIATAAANGQLKGRVLWLWDVPMESEKVIEWLESIVKNAPYADMSATALSVLADYLVQKGRHEEAAVVYKRLVDNYPDSRYAPGAQIMLARLLASSHTRGDRNLVNIDRAREAYEEFSLLFPNHSGMKEARAGAAEMQRLLVQQELEVGKYYMERAREYTAAAFCFNDVIRRGTHNPQAAAEARTLLQRIRPYLPSSTKPQQ